jgi:sulfur-carrier protein
MKSINIHYFASFREKTGVQEESLQVNSLTYGDLFEELSRKYKFDLPLSMVQLAVDDEFVSFSAPVSDGSKVVFIPPVAGG